jgi:hypothetical protein
MVDLPKIFLEQKIWYNLNQYTSEYQISPIFNGLYTGPEREWWTILKSTTIRLVLELLELA